GADPLVAVPAARERARPRRGKPFVVDVPDALERVERLEPLVRVDSGTCQAFVDLAPRAVPMLQHARRDLYGIALRCHLLNRGRLLLRVQDRRRLRTSAALAALR